LEVADQVGAVMAAGLAVVGWVGAAMVEEWVEGLPSPYLVVG
jgi:hypothetical protein